MTADAFAVTNHVVGLSWQAHETWLDELHRGLRRHLNDLHDALDASIVSDPDEEPAVIDMEQAPVDETGLTWCGCAACHDRAVLAYLIPRVLGAAGDGLLEVVPR